MYIYTLYFIEMYWNLEYIFKIVRHAHPAQHQTTLRPCPRAPFLLPLVRLFPWNMHQSSYLTKIFSPVLIDADESVMSTFACIASALMHCSGVSDYVFGYLKHHQSPLLSQSRKDGFHIKRTNWLTDKVPRALQKNAEMLNFLSNDFEIKALFKFK